MSDHDAHVVHKRRVRGDRDGKETFYLVGPTRARADEALRDLRAYREGADLQGQVAALWGQVAALRGALERIGNAPPPDRADDEGWSCAGIIARAALAPGAGEGEG